MKSMTTRLPAWRSALIVAGVLCLASCTLAAADFTPIEKAPESCNASPYGPGDYRRDFEVEGDTRTYLVHIPPGYERGEPLPVVLNFHGGGGNATSQVELTGMNDTADADNFIVVYPSGSGRLKPFRTFNAGSCCGFARDKGIDDVQFTSQLLDDLARIFCIDPQRVYATGHSNGAMMAYRLACELSDRIAAIAPVAGPMGVDRCSPSRPVPVLHFHGTADQCAPFAGGSGASKDAGEFRSVEGSIEQWAKLNGCEGEPRVTLDEGHVTCTTYSRCRGDAEVTLCTIAGGGHAWPGGRKYPAEKICGGTLSREISANDVMWKFFAQHSLAGGREPAGPEREPKSPLRDREEGRD